MRYEKKMLILSGEGKGVVLLEKSGLGVKFALRTFGVPPTADLNAGVVTPSGVFIRALPFTPDPSAVFYIDIPSIDELQFAVFDAKLRLSGAIGPSMWEANLMDLLQKHAHPISAPVVTPAALPPLAVKPKSLPLPDGTGLPQSRLSIYGDDALADSDFYTPFDLSARMIEVDGFLDTPRVLESAQKMPDEMSDATALSLDGTDIDKGLPDDIDDDIVDNIDGIDGEKSELDDIDASETEAEREAAAVAADETAETVEETYDEKPWARAARWLKDNSSREPIARSATVRAVKRKSEIRSLRVADFFERCRADVEKLFENAPVDDELGKLLPELKWVKVPVGSHTISVGRDGDILLCYAVLGSYEKSSPLGETAQWLPRLKTAPTGKGYWLVFQNLSTGEVVS